jgi:soluble lytic murein transglycosylase-like protein
VLVCGAATVKSGNSWLRSWIDIPSPFVAPLNVYELLVDTTPVVVTVYAGGQYAPWRTTAHAIRTDVAMWRRMHLANWNSVPAGLRAEGLDALLAKYRSVLMNPQTWDRMTADDWDEVPQPVRTVAYRQMVGYWTGFYGIGRTYDLPPGLVTDYAAAIMMSESWFDHRAVRRDRSGNTDIGLAQASDFARARMSELYRLGLVDVEFATKDYFNPWSATRFAALWFGLLLDEASGHVDLAVRAYNRGIARAHDQRGSAYLAAVERRLHRFIRNNNAPTAWSHVWTRARAIESEEWPWMSRVNYASRFGG